MKSDKQSLNPKIRFKQGGYSSYPDWKVTTIGQSGSFSYGKSAPKWSISTDAATPCVRYGELYTTHRYVVKEITSFTNIDPRLLRYSVGGEVLVPRVGEDPQDFCKCAYLPFPNIAIGEMISIYRTSQNGLFISYLFNSRMKKEFAKRVEGGNVSNLYYPYLEDIKMRIPCLEEQQKIASFFSTLDQKIELNERKLEALEKLKKGVMQKIFKRAIRFKKNGEDFPKWNKVKIKEMGEIKTGTTPKNNQEGVYGGPHYWVTPTDIKSKEIYQTNKTLTDSGLQSGRVIPANSVLVTCIASIGKNAILRRKGSCNQQINAITPNQNFNVDFVYYAITHAEPILHRLAGQGGMEIINKRDFSEVELFVPCLEEQNAIAAFLSSLDRKIQISSERINNLNSLKQGFMQQMFV